eukprot:scaffold16.g86.t1
MALAGGHHFTFKLASGRTLSYVVYGASVQRGGGRPVLVFLHSVPSSAAEAAPLHDAAAAAGVTVLAPDRAGIGGSSPDPALSLASAAADLRELLDKLGLGPVAVAGKSGGAPYAVAAAALLGPTLVSQLHLVAPWGPLEDKKLFADFPNGHDRMTISWLHWPLKLGRPLAGAMQGAMKSMAQDTPDKLEAEAGNDLGPSDKGAYKQGLTGVFADYLVIAGRWTGVDMGAIKCKTVIWQGADDKNVPLSHAQWYETHVPGATLRLLEGEGNVTIPARRGKDIMEAVLAGL